MTNEKKYICIDLKSFYASIECIKRGLDPLNTNLVVADSSRTEKTICLAVSPSLKSYGIPGRARLFEVLKKVKEINQERLHRLKSKNGKNSIFLRKSFYNSELLNNECLEMDFIIAVPNMQHYIDVSSKIYHIYLKYIAKEDIHVYSIDEVFIDVSNYLNTYKMSANELAKRMIQEVLKETGVTATAGIGTNLYLAKVAMDIVAKHIDADEDGVRIAELNEMSYRKILWNHLPITDFWRVGKGYKESLDLLGLYTMGDIARYSIQNEDKLYQKFGINAELLIDHAWGYEPVTIKDIKKYQPLAKSLGTGQVLHNSYNFEKAKLIIKEMLDLLVLELVDKGFLTNTIVITIGYDIENLKNQEIRFNYTGEITTDYLGRKIPKHAHGTINFDDYTSSTKIITNKVLKAYDKITNRDLLIKRINITACSLILESDYQEHKPKIKQLTFFDNQETEKKEMQEKINLEKERKTQEVILKIKKKYGKNAVLKGMNLEEGATTVDRNKQIGGHKA